MIEINLIAQPKKFKMPTVLGVDLSIINIKLVVLAYVISVVGESYYHEYFDEQVKKYEEQTVELNKQLRGLRSSLTEAGDLRAELTTYNRQLERLRARTEQVRVIINQRTNPKPLLEKVARNLPADMWINLIEIRKDRTILLKGAAESYSSIGNFIIATNDSPFFDDLNLAQSATEEVMENGVPRRIEAFEIQGRISSYEEKVQ